MIEQRGKKQWVSSGRKICWATLSNETWHLPYSKEGGEEGEKDDWRREAVNYFKLVQLLP